MKKLRGRRDEPYFIELEGSRYLALPDGSRVKIKQVLYSDPFKLVVVDYRGNVRVINLVKPLQIPPTIITYT